MTSVLFNNLNLKSVNTLSGHYISQDDLIYCMQWNIRSLHKNSSFLRQLLHKYPVDICALQELQVHYKKADSSVFNSIKDYTLYTDTYCKTGVLVNNKLTSQQLNICPDINDNQVKQNIYVTAVEINYNTHYLIIISIYLSPAYNQGYNNLRTYLCNIQNNYKQKHISHGSLQHFGHATPF